MITLNLDCGLLVTGVVHHEMSEDEYHHNLHALYCVQHDCSADCRAVLCCTRWHHLFQAQILPGFAIIMRCLWIRDSTSVWHVPRVHTHHAVYDAVLTMLSTL